MKLLKDNDLATGEKLSINALQQIPTPSLTAQPPPPSFGLRVYTIITFPPPIPPPNLPPILPPILLPILPPILPLIFPPIILLILSPIILPILLPFFHCPLLLHSLFNVQFLSPLINNPLSPPNIQFPYSVVTLILSLSRYNPSTIHPPYNTPPLQYNFPTIKSPYNTTLLQYNPPTKLSLYNTVPPQYYPSTI